MVMDFFKNCTTNVHVVENFTQTRYSSFSLTEQDDDTGWACIQNTLIGLREKNVLCSAAGDEIWAFGEAGKAHMQENRRFRVNETGSVGSDGSKSSSQGKLLRDILLDAIESSVAFALAQETSTTQVGPWKWIHSEMDEEDERFAESSLITLHVKFARTGALYLIPEIKVTALSPLRSFDVGTTTILAPSNKLAKILPADTPKVVSDARWKDNLSLAMQAQGVKFGETPVWIPVQPINAEGAASLLWPSQLCFTHSSHTHQPGFLEDQTEWRPWFATTDDNVTFRNPLVLAEEWFQNALERDRMAQAMANGEAGATTAVDPNNLQMNATQTFGNDANSTISPPMNQRLLEQQAAMAGIYPTPPDGLAHPNQGSQQFNPATTPSVTQGDTALSGNDLLPTSDQSLPKSAEVDVMTGLDGFPMEQEDLFGDVGQMGFEENDIGDADFNFFDDQPDELPISDNGEDALMLEAPNQPDEMDGTVTQDVDGLSGVMKIELPESVPEVLDTGLQTESDQQKRVAEPEEVVENQPETDVKEEPPGLPFDQSDPQLENPLSPFGIREKLLPPPVPASIAQNDAKEAEHRRNSAFSPIIFRNVTDLKEKYAIDETRISTRISSNPVVPDIRLPKTRKKSRTVSREAVPQRKLNEDSESEEDSFESSSSESEPDLPPKMPWDNKKRKRHSEHDLLYPLAGTLAQMRSDDPANDDTASHLSSVETMELLRKYMMPAPEETPITQSPTAEDEAIMSLDSFNQDTSADSLAVLEETNDVAPEDLVYIAQVISMQAVTALDPIRSSSEMLCADLSQQAIISSAPRKLIHQTLEATFSGIETCDLPKIAVSREPAPPSRTASAPGKPMPGQPPRPPPRADSMMNNPDYFPLQAPYVRIQRGTDNWEMLPSCLSFWETLGLGPANGSKDVRAFCVFPDNDDLQSLVEHFLADIGIAYEGCKLGSHTHLRNVGEDDSFEDGMVPVELEENSMQGALKAYAHTCIDLGKVLASLSHKETDRTIVVYMVNPFPGHQAAQHLCACFWQLYNVYRDNIPKAHRNQCSSDVVLQLIPISLVAAADMMIVPDPKEMALLAREVYDRCPPSSATQTAENTSVLPILAAPSLELASAAPRKIGFQLAAEPPSDLLHEGSILHLAYAISKDGLWMTAVWVDNTSQHQSSTSYCLRGRSFADVAEDVWERTREIIATRQVTWRVFVVTHEAMDKYISQCWRSLCSKPRPQSLCVTLLSVQLESIVQLSPPAPPESSGPLDAGFLTPASTPQAANFTSSPDVTGHGSGGNAPPTPAPSEIADNDPDAHLIDVTDETWGCILSPKLANETALASGALYRRGCEENKDAALGSLGVSVHWTIQVKTTGAVDEGSPKQCELTLREVLRMYRNLGLLTRARGLEEADGSLKGPVPVHIASAVRGARGLEGMLRKGL